MQLIFNSTDLMAQPGNGNGKRAFIRPRPGFGMRLPRTTKENLANIFPIGLNQKNNTEFAGICVHRAEFGAKDFVVQLIRYKMLSNRWREEDGEYWVDITHEGPETHFSAPAIVFEKIGDMASNGKIVELTPEIIQARLAKFGIELSRGFQRVSGLIGAWLSGGVLHEGYLSKTGDTFVKQTAANVELDAMLLRVLEVFKFLPEHICEGLLNNYYLGLGGGCYGRWRGRTKKNDIGEWLVKAPYQVGPFAVIPADQAWRVYEGRSNKDGLKGGWVVSHLPGVWNTSITVPGEVSSEGMLEWKRRA